MTRRIAWDISHQEFTIEDHYYFSILKRELVNSGADVVELRDLRGLAKFDVLVINYPEKKFGKDEAKQIIRFVEQGGRVLVLGYYKNEDNIAETVNSISQYFGLELLHDEIYDERNNLDDDKYLIVTSKVLRFNKGVSKILMPCTAPIRTLDENIEIVAKAEETAKTKLGNKPIIAAMKQFGKGQYILIGSCVFWDNFSIEKYDNLKFALNLLLE